MTVCVCGDAVVEFAVDEAAALDAALVVASLWAKTRLEPSSKDKTDRRVMRHVEETVMVEEAAHYSEFAQKRLQARAEKWQKERTKKKGTKNARLVGIISMLLNKAAMPVVQALPNTWRVRPLLDPTTISMGADSLLACYQLRFPERMHPFSPWGQNVNTVKYF